MNIVKQEAFMDYTYDGKITATEFKQNLGKYLDYVADNHEVVITKNGQPAVRVSPYVSKIVDYMMLKEEAPKYGEESVMVSYEEFLEISGRAEGRMEYINGEIIMQSSPNSFHQDAVGNLYMIIRLFLKGKKCKVYLAPFDVTLYKVKKDGERLKTPDVIQPDLLVACDTEEKINEKGRYSGVPTLVVEVLSPSTRTRDILVKCNSFMLGGCNEYWVIDVNKKTLMQYVFEDHEVLDCNTYGIGNQVTSSAVSGLAFMVDEIFEE
jgi:prevent-host-death family protein